MTPPALKMLRVDKDAAPEVLDICLDAAVWLKKMGMDQWSSFFDPEKAKFIIHKRFEEGEVYLGYWEGIAVATVTLQWKDDFWGELGGDRDSGYIHTMAVRRDFAGRGFGREILDWTGDYFAEAGRVKTRLDCFENNLRLCRYYDESGFRTIGRREWQGEHLVMKER
jgi:ribosomal protein S18 acetylase RimI-like enzyme